MARHVGASARRPRISVDVRPDVRRRLRIAATKQELSVGQYVIKAVEERLLLDLGADHEGVLSLNEAADPVLAELWDNPRDAKYDQD